MGLDKLLIRLQMYQRTMQELYENYNCQYVVLDIKKGSYENIVRSSKLFSMLCRLGLDRYIIVKQEDSYEQKLHGGKSEQFQRLELFLPVIVKMMKVYSWLNYIPFYKSPKQTIQQGETFKEENPHSISNMPKESPLTILYSKAYRGCFAGLVFSTAVGLPLWLSLRKQ